MTLDKAIIHTNTCALIFIRTKKKERERKRGHTINHQNCLFQHLHFFCFVLLEKPKLCVQCCDPCSAVLSSQYVFDWWKWFLVDINTMEQFTSSQDIDAIIYHSHEVCRILCYYFPYAGAAHTHSTKFTIPIYDERLICLYIWTVELLHSLLNKPIVCAFKTHEQIQQNCNKRSINTLKEKLTNHLINSNFSANWLWSDCVSVWWTRRQYMCVRACVFAYKVLHTSKNQSRKLSPLRKWNVYLEMNIANDVRERARIR